MQSVDRSILGLFQKYSNLEYDFEFFSKNVETETNPNFKNILRI